MINHRNTKESNKMVEHAKAAGDWLSLGASVGAVVGWLPSVAAFLSALYTVLRLYEWFENRRKLNKTTREMNYEESGTTL